MDKRRRKRLRRIMEKEAPAEAAWDMWCRMHEHPTNYLSDMDGPAAKQLWRAMIEERARIRLKVERIIRYGKS